MSEPVFQHPQNLFIGHVYLQHTGAEYLEHVNLRYHGYLTPEDYDLQDAIVYAYQWSIKIVIEDTAEEETCARRSVISLSDYFGRVSALFNIAKI